ncbi:MAG: hypothetical protein A2157_08390 [Deltaproteobacteria bacterium RBG_16_47_11]|nr:MAG: hypothetical protein A2157_08390 [Deltaproteobacteria bacterium RBG_16_47_11]
MRDPESLKKIAEMAPLRSMKSKFNVNERDIQPAKVKSEEGWREMNIRWLLSEKTVGSRNAVLFKAIIKAGAAHEKHIHHKADELVYIISGKARHGQGDEEWEEWSTGAMEPIPMIPTQLAGERIFNLKRMVSVRRGINRKDDTLPPRILTPKLMEGGTKGNLPFLGFMLNEYYSTRGWSEEETPTREKLIQLGLKECL